MPNLSPHYQDALPHGGFNPNNLYVKPWRGARLKNEEKGKERACQALYRRWLSKEGEDTGKVNLFFYLLIRPSTPPVSYKMRQAQQY
jgi:hypothetical protein